MVSYLTSTHITGDILFSIVSVGYCLVKLTGHTASKQYVLEICFVTNIVASIGTYIIGHTYLDICDRPWDNRPSSHLVVIVEIPVLKVLISVTIVLGRLNLVELDLLIYAKQKQPGAVKKGVAKQSKIKNIEALVRACG